MKIPYVTKTHSSHTVISSSVLSNWALRTYYIHLITLLWETGLLIPAIHIMPLLGQQLLESQLPRKAAAINNSCFSHPSPRTALPSTCWLVCKQWPNKAGHEGPAGKPARFSGRDNGSMCFLPQESHKHSKAAMFHMYVMFPRRNKIILNTKLSRFLLLH